MILTASRYYLIHSSRELRFLETSDVYFYLYSYWYSNTLKCFTYEVILNVPCTPKLIQSMIYDYMDDIQIHFVRKVRIYG